MSAWYSSSCDRILMLNGNICRLSLELVAGRFRDPTLSVVLSETIIQGSTLSYILPHTKMANLLFIQVAHLPSLQHRTPSHLPCVRSLVNPQQQAPLCATLPPLHSFFENRDLSFNFISHEIIRLSSSPTIELLEYISASWSSNRTRSATLRNIPHILLTEASFNQDPFQSHCTLIPHRRNPTLRHRGIADWTFSSVGIQAWIKAVFSRWALVAASYTSLIVVVPLS